jgi:hypothetical protein
MVKKKAGLIRPLNYLTTEVSAGILAVLSVVALPTLAESTTVDVESLVSVAVDPEPQAVNATIAVKAIINVYFFILVNIRNIFETIKFYNKKPQRCVGV